MQWTDSIATNKSFVLEWGEGVKMAGFVFSSQCESNIHFYSGLFIG